MTELQKLILDALDHLGSMDERELQYACLIDKKQRGGFRTSLNRLFDKHFVRALGTDKIALSAEGVWEIEKQNRAREALVVPNGDR